ncbi:MAG TPA: hypothetical protein VNQ33_07135 [Acidimicrobiales bacterium]|nr:hypothetical protein [Acidimicrobiales bacterium]
MKVSELADELEVPTSTVLAQCQRFGIDASWAGAELSGADVVVLRSELASGAPIDLTPADPVEEPVAVAAGSASPAPRPSMPAAGAEAPPTDPAPPDGSTGDPADLPPTAVGSMPDVAAEVTPDAEPVASAPTGPGGHQGRAGGPLTPDGSRPVAPRTPPAAPRFDRAVRGSVIALVVAAGAYAGSNVVDLAVVVALLWLVAAVALVVAVIDAIRGRRHALTHPDRVRGAWLATFALLFAVAGIIGLTASVLAVTADDPADAPLDLSDLGSVQVARWGYQRTSLLAGNGWRQVARDSGSCWRHEDRRNERAEDRVEATKANVSDTCQQGHTLEVVKVFAYDRDADAPYPGADKILIAAQEKCADVFAQVQEELSSVKTDVEYPTEVGWGDADHDVACTVSTDAERSGKLAP